MKHTNGTKNNQTKSVSQNNTAQKQNSQRGASIKK
jgi:hypothetical protein